jgi:hypothetical protein
MRFVYLILLVVGVSSVSAAELNSLNTIDYHEGETIEIATRVLDGAISQTDVTCGVYVNKESDNSTALAYTNMSLNSLDEHYDYYWVPTLTWWENIQQIWDPSVGNYYAYIDCTGGSLLNETVLTDTVLIRVVA